MITDKKTLSALNSVQDFINQNNPLTEEERSQFKSDGFLLPSTFSADGNGLPYSKVESGRKSQVKRNIITWFVPEFGTIKMYVNPNSIDYSYKKAIKADRTKGGFTLQYWGEDLARLQIRGTTGSSGIEGINMLYEIYRAEQYAADGIALSLSAAANNSTNNIASQAISALGARHGNDAAVAGSIAGGLLGAYSQSSNALASKNIVTLAQLAFSVEMYYNGWVFRGYFEDMTINERADNFLFDYSLTFAVTQRRGYRVNYFPWQRSPSKETPSNYSTPLSLDPYNVST